MTKWARIQNNKVSEITDIDPAGRFHPSIKWIEVPEETKQNWIYDESTGEVTEPPQLTEEELLQRKRQSMTVSKYQAKAALKSASLLQQVKDYMATLDEDHDARLAWDNVQEFRRLSPMVESIGTELGLTDEQIDDLFEQAKQIEA